MKNQKITLGDVKNALKRDEMRAITGGCGGSSDWMKCCWNGTHNCSTCAQGSVCVTGAYLTPC